MPIWDKNKNTQELGNDLCWQKRSSACKWCSSPVRLFVPHVRSGHFMSFRYVDYTGYNKSWTKLSIWSTHAIKQTMVWQFLICAFFLVQSQFSSEYRSVVSIYSRGCLNCPHWTLTRPNMPETNSNKFKSKHVWSLNPSNQSQDPGHTRTSFNMNFFNLPRPAPNHQRKKLLFSNVLPI